MKILRRLSSNKTTLITVILSIVIIVLVVPQVQEYQSLWSDAAADRATVFFNPNTETLTTVEKTFPIWIDTAVGGVAFARVEVTFDPALVMLTKDPVPVNPALTQIVEITSMNTANTTGKIVVVVGLDPAKTAPSGAFNFVELNLKTKTNATANTTLTISTNDSQLVNTKAIAFELISTPLNLSLNPVAEPSPTLTATPSSPTSTPTPTVSSDQVAPEISFTYPKNDELLARNTNITLDASASDNVGVSQVQFFVNGSLQCSDDSAPYTCDWKTGNGKKSYTFKATAFDAAGNTASSTVTAKNK